MREVSPRVPVSPRREERGKMLIKALVTAVGLAAIVWVNWYFLLGGKE